MAYPQDEGQFILDTGELLIETLFEQLMRRFEAHTKSVIILKFIQS